MSFGKSSQRFQTAVSDGKPMIFWEQQKASTRETARNKKFNKIRRVQKYPIRKNVPEQQVDQTSRTAKKPLRPSNQQTNKPPATLKGSKTTNKHDPNTVTLTTTELTAILDTIKSIAASNQDPSNKSNAAEVAAKVKESLNNSNSSDKTPAASELPPSETVPHPLTSYQGPKIVQVDPGPQIVEPTHIPGLDPTPPSSARAMNRPADPRNNPRNNPTSMQTPAMNAQVAAPPKILSKAEQKRLQWEKERAELQADYDPWGRPGAGAPVRDDSGHVLTDYHSKKAYMQRQESQEVRNAPLPPAPPQMQPSPRIAQSDLPAAMRSSFVLGHQASDANSGLSAKELQKKQWLQELEKQREEQRLKKLKEKEFYNPTGNQDSWADRFNTDYKAKGLPEQNIPPPVTSQTPPANHFGDSSARNDALRTSSAPVDNQTAERSDFVRGHNALLDSTTQKEMDEKRKRYKEHQDAIKAQVEEKQRLKQLERERRMAEELEEERKLQAERDALQHQYDLEKQKAKEKEETAMKRHEQLKQAMEQAQEEAARERHAHRLRKLQQGGHDVSHLHASFEAKHTPRSEEPVAPAAPAVAATPAMASVPAETLPVDSTTKEFGIQTDNQDVSDNSSVNIEFYPPPPKPKKKLLSLVRVAEEIEVNEIEGNPEKSKKGKAKPKWGVKEVKKKPLSMSERDPNYQKRKQEREAQRKLRQQQMMEEAAKFAPKAAGGSTRARSRSRDRGPVKSKKEIANVDNGRNNPGDGQHPGKKTDNEDLYEPYARKKGKSTPTVSRQQSRRQASPPIPTLQDNKTRSPSPPIPTVQANQRQSRLENAKSRANERQSRIDGDPLSSRLEKHQTPRSVAAGNPRSTSPPIPTIKNKIRNESPVVPPSILSNRRNSPPVPALKKMTEHGNYQPDQQSLASDRSQGKHYRDPDIISAPINNNDFIPFVRSINVLDPSHADDPLPMSRENTAVSRARKAYHQNIQPANFGEHMENHVDQKPEYPVHQPPVIPSTEKNPIVNPGLVKDHPTMRQDRILQQLSDLRRGLMQKQRELEVSMNA